MDALLWLRDYAQVPIRPVYAVFGDDPYLIRESVRRIVRSVFPADEIEAAVSRFPGVDVPLASVLDEVRMLSFFTRKRIVIVEEADPFVTKYRKELEAYVEHPYESGILVLQVKQWPSSTRLAKLVEKLGVAINCSGPRESELVAWLIQHAATECDAQLDTDASRLLVELIGPRQESWRRRLRNWRFTSARQNESSGATSPGWWARGGSRRSGKRWIRRWPVRERSRWSIWTASCLRAKSQSGCLRQ
jgi:DNA polymerase-3 subunit delta